jgi:type I restriction enzyme M protein
MANNHSNTERRLWDAADEFRANSDLKSSEYATPVLGLVFLRFADHRFTHAEKELTGKGSGRRTIGKEDYQAKGVMYLPPTARFSHLLSLPEGENIGRAINEAMKAIEAENEELKGVLPRTYTKIDNGILVSLLKNFSQIALDAEGDTFGKIYEYFLGNFARAEGQRGGEFFTPTTLVKLIVEIIEPYHGRIEDPACGSGGMFVQSAGFIKSHRRKMGAEKGSDPDSRNGPAGASHYRGLTPFPHLDVMVAIGPNFFYTVTLPCTLWFFDKGKATLPDSGSPRPASGTGSKSKSGSPRPASGRGAGGEGKA